MECLFCHPPPEERTDKAIDLLAPSAIPWEGHYRSVMQGAAPCAWLFRWPFEPQIDSRIRPAWLSARIPTGDQCRPCLHALYS